MKTIMRDTWCACFYLEWLEFFHILLHHVYESPGFGDSTGRTGSSSIHVVVPLILSAPEVLLPYLSHPLRQQLLLLLIGGSHFCTNSETTWRLPCSFWQTRVLDSTQNEISLFTCDVLLPAVPCFGHCFFMCLLRSKPNWYRLHRCFHVEIYQDKEKH